MYNYFKFSGIIEKECIWKIKSTLGVENLSRLGLVDMPRISITRPARPSGPACGHGKSAGVRSAFWSNGQKTCPVWSEPGSPAAVSAAVSSCWQKNIKVEPLPNIWWTIIATDSDWIWTSLFQKNDLTIRWCRPFAMRHIGIIELSTT